MHLRLCYDADDVTDEYDNYDNDDTDDDNNYYDNDDTDDDNNYYDNNDDDYDKHDTFVNNVHEPKTCILHIFNMELLSLATIVTYLAVTWFVHLNDFTNLVYLSREVVKIS